MTQAPVRPNIPVGLGTKVGLSASVVQFVGVLVTVLLDGDHSEETISLLVTATVTLVTVLWGRFKQADTAIKQETAVRTALVTQGLGGDVPPANRAVSEPDEGSADYGALGEPDEPYLVEDLEEIHEKRDIHDAEGF